mmetsp:Transcript_24118/g.64701  ORF Transcript_24118/g.64701 Transcript_24118/m.64701 type:complete len:508 (-) Transcript_24118:7-1530(-)
MDDAVAGSERDAATVHDEVGQRVVRVDVDGLGVGGRVAEGLHDEVGGEAEAGEVLELVARHRARRVLRADGRHERLAVLARQHAGLAARLADHLLRERVAGGRGHLAAHRAEGVGRGEAQRLARARRDGAADDERDAAAGADLVEERVGLDGEIAEDLVGAVHLGDALVRVDVDHVAHVELGHVHLDRQRARVLHRVEEDGRNLAADAHAARPLVGHARDVVAHVPQDRVGRRLARRARADDVANVREREALGLQPLDLASDVVVLDAVARELEHRQRVQRDVRPRERVRRRRQVVRVRLARHLEHRHRNLLGHLGLREEPLGVGPRLHHRLRGGVAGLGLPLDVVEGVEHEDRLAERRRRGRRKLGVVERVHQWRDVVAALHGAEHLDGERLADQGRRGLALDNGGEEAGLDVGGLVDTRRHALLEQREQRVRLIRGRLHEQLRQLRRLRGVDRLGHDALRRALVDVLLVRRHERRREASIHAQTRRARGAHHLGRRLQGTHCCFV